MVVDCASSHKKDTDSPAQAQVKRYQELLFAVILRSGCNTDWDNVLSISEMLVWNNRCNGIPGTECIYGLPPGLGTTFS